MSGLIPWVMDSISGTTGKVETKAGTEAKGPCEQMDPTAAKWNAQPFDELENKLNCCQPHYEEHPLIVSTMAAKAVTFSQKAKVFLASQGKRTTILEELRRFEPVRFEELASIIPLCSRRYPFFCPDENAKELLNVILTKIASINPTFEMWYSLPGEGTIVRALKEAKMAKTASNFTERLQLYYFYKSDNPKKIELLSALWAEEPTLSFNDQVNLCNTVYHQAQIRLDLLQKMLERESDPLRLMRIAELAPTGSALQDNAIEKSITL